MNDVSFLFVDCCVLLDREVVVWLAWEGRKFAGWKFCISCVELDLLVPLDLRGLVRR